MISYTGDDDFDEILDRCLKTLESKGKDYAEEGDRLAEFKATAAETGVTVRQAFGVYLNKHLRSVKKWVRGEELEGEPIEEKLLDVIVYCLLGYKIFKEEHEQFMKEETSIDKTIAESIDRNLLSNYKKPYTSKSCGHELTPPSEGFCKRELRHYGECILDKNATHDTGLCGKVWTADNKKCTKPFKHGGSCKI